MIAIGTDIPSQRAVSSSLPPPASSLRQTGGSVVFVQMDQQTIADYPVGAAATTPTFRYVYASYIDEPVVRKGPTSTSTAHFFHRNQQYSVTAITTSTGAIAERYAYTAYGQPTILNASGTVISATTLSNRYSYTGREWDATLGLHHFQARWMSPSAGRFFTRDPIGFRGSPKNLYKAFFSVSGMDPSGWTCISNCEDQCAQIYPHWYQWHLFAGCVAGCPSGCANQPFGLCNYVRNNMSNRYKDGIGCLCGVVEVLDLVFPPNRIVATADCICEFLTGIINSCDSGSWGILPVHIADCAIDIAGVAGVPGLEWYDRLLVSVHDRPADLLGGRVAMSREIC